MDRDDDVIQTLEIDLEVAEIGQILAAHGITPTPRLVVALWDWVEELRTVARGGDQ